MSTVLCNDYAGRQLISDIAPIEGVETPYTITSGNFWGETATVDNPVLIYRSAFGKYYASAENDYCMVVAFFDSEPTLSGRYGDSATKVNYSGNYWYVYFSRSNRGSEATSDIITFNTLESWKEYIFSPMQPPYNWQSVPSISGKNGILQSLVQIKEEALNDGEPVSEATVLSFDSLGNINIPSVIDEQMPEDPTDTTAVTVTYLIPKLDYGTYDTIKLLIKKDAIPSSAADADVVVDIDEPTNILRIGVKAVGSLSPNSHYYFMIAVADDIGTEATSDVQDIWTGKRKGYIIETVRITRGAIETGIIETVSVTKQE